MRSVVAVAVVALAAVAAAEDRDRTFPEWMEHHGKSYPTVEEERYRELVFNKNKVLIDELNQKRSHITLGPTWGEAGYIRLGRGSAFAPAGECGILLDPSYPVV